MHSCDSRYNNNHHHYHRVAVEDEVGLWTDQVTSIKSDNQTQSENRISQTPPVTINSSLETVQCWRQYNVIRKTIPHVNNTKAEEICSQFCPAISFLDL